MTYENIINWLTSNSISYKTGVTYSTNLKWIFIKIDNVAQTSHERTVLLNFYFDKDDKLISMKWS